jgi:hypothetical protein
MIAMSATAKAVIEILLIINGKRGGVFFVKRTASLEFTARTRDFDALAYHLRQTEAMAYIV